MIGVGNKIMVPKSGVSNDGFYVLTGLLSPYKSRVLTNYGSLYFDKTLTARAFTYEAGISATGKKMLLNDRQTDTVRIYTSVDYGETWSTVVLTGRYAHSMCISKTEGAFYILCDDYLYRSVDGINFSSLTNYFFYRGGLAVSYNGSTILSARNNNLIGSTNGGTSFGELSTLPFYTSTAFVADCDEDASHILVSGAGKLYISRTGVTGTWIDITPDTTVDVKFASISANGQYILAQGNAEKYWLSNDYGDSWTEITAMTNINFANIKAVTVSMSGKYMYIIGSGWKIWASTDFGATWSYTGIDTYYNTIITN